MIQSPTIMTAHRSIIYNIVNRHFIRVTEDGETTFEYPTPMVVQVDFPTESPMIHEKVGYSEAYMEEYSKGLLFKSTANFEYTYGNRFRDYGDSHIDQIDYVIQKLLSSPETRRAILHTWDNSLDLTRKDVPCLQDVQFLLGPADKEGTRKLNLIAYFRSNDMLMAWGCNAYALTKLLQCIIACMHKPNIVPGILTTISASAHIYARRDESTLRSLGYNVAMYY